MKVTSLPAASLLLAGSANALFGGKPPPQPKPEVVGSFTWANPFKSDTMSTFDSACDVSSTFSAYEFTLRDLMNPFPKGLRAWAPGLKTLFQNREYPGSWEGWDRHLNDRSILLMEYSLVPLEVRRWIETEDRTGGPGKGLFGVFDKPTEENEKINETVDFSDPSINRKLDKEKVVIFAPGALYHILPLWTASSSVCPEDLLNLARYTTTPEAGGVVAWVENSKPEKKEKKDMKFSIKAQLLKGKPEPEPEPEAATSEDAASEETASSSSSAESSEESVVRDEL